MCITCSLLPSPWYHYACWRLSFPHTRIAKEAIKGRVASLFSDVLFLQHHRLGWPRPDWILLDGSQEEKAYAQRLSSLLHSRCDSLRSARIRRWMSTHLAIPSLPEGRQILILRTIEPSPELMEKDLHEWGSTYQVRFLSLVRKR